MHDWEARFAPLLTKQQRSRRKGKAGHSWYIDETYIKVGGKWRYLYWMEQDHRGVKQRKTKDGDYPMRGFGNFDAASRFCSAYEEQRRYFRYGTRPKERVPLSEQRRMLRQRYGALQNMLMSA